MKITTKKIEIFLLVILYLLALYIWTLPIQNNRLPFGDVDASSHFTIGDYMVTYDRSVLKIPYPITFRYRGQNALFPDYLWYAPQYWTNTGIMQVFGGERVFPPFIIIAIFSSLIILSSYFLIRNLFGFWTAFLSSLLLIFSTRDYMVYLWGQWPQSLSFAFTPLVLYSFYHYYKNHKEDNNQSIYYKRIYSKPIYLYILALFLSAQFLFHPQGLIASVAALIIFSLILLIKNKKIPFNIKHLITAVILFALVSVISAPFNVGEFLVELTTKQESSAGGGGGVAGGGTDGAGNLQLDKLFRWYHGIKNDPGLPDFYFRYPTSHGSGPFKEVSLLSWWTLPFLLIGVFVLIYRRKEEDFLLISWLVSYYLLTRLVVFGIGQRDIRMFAYEAHVFYPIIALGLVSISSIAKQETLRKYIKYSLIILFLILAISINGKSTYDVLKSQQYSIGRINPSQYEAAEWVRGNIEENADIYGIGTLGYQYFGAKIKWLGVLSQRHFILDNDKLNMTDYIFLDYTDASLLKNQDYINTLQNIEAKLNWSPLYNKNNIKVYKLAGNKI